MIEDLPHEQYVIRSFANLLPPHKCSLSLEHNPNRNFHETVEQWEGNYKACSGSDSNWVSEEQKAKAIANNEVWVLHWYPDTPVGFIRLLACDLDVLLTIVHEGNHKK